MSSNYDVHIITWNVGETDPPSDISPLFHFSNDVLPNIYVIGLQEMRSTSLSILADSLFNDPWTILITQHLSKKNYIRLKSLRMMGTHLSVYIQRDDLKHVTNLQNDFTHTAFAGYWGSKGGISLSLEIFGVNLCFVNCHFSAHLENSLQRIQDFNQIVLNQKFQNKEQMNILDHDYVFWIGDTNFRFDDLDRSKVIQLIGNCNYKELILHDQLINLKKKEQVFVDFTEGDINFPPTYKYDNGTDNYDTSSKNRIPAWCDRVLWRVQEDGYEGVKLSVEQHVYTSVQLFRNSDHKPVVSSFTIQVLSQTPSDVRVIFEPLGRWDTNKPNRVDYTIPNDFLKSSNDWIALYNEKYVSIEQYSSFIWACVQGGRDMGDGTQLFTVTFDRPQFVGLKDGYYQLIYHSYINNCPAGISGPLKLVGCNKLEVVDMDSDVDLLENPKLAALNTYNRPTTAVKSRRLKDYSSPVDSLDQENTEVRKVPRQEIDSDFQHIRHSLQQYQDENDQQLNSNNEIDSDDDNDSDLMPDDRHKYSDDSEEIMEEEDGGFEFLRKEEAVSVIHQSDQHAYAEEYEQLRNAAIQERHERMLKKEDGQDILQNEIMMESSDIEKRCAVEESIEQELMERNLGGFSKALGIHDHDNELELITRTSHKNIKQTADGDEEDEDECVAVKQSVLLGRDQLFKQSAVTVPHQISKEVVPEINKFEPSKSLDTDPCLNEALNSLDNILQNVDVTKSDKNISSLIADEESLNEENICEEIVSIKKQPINEMGNASLFQQEVLEMKKESIQHSYQDDYEALRDAAIAEREARAEARERARLEGGEEVKVVTTFVESTRVDDSVVADVEQQLLNTNLNNFDKFASFTDEFLVQDHQVKKVEAEVRSGAIQSDQSNQPSLIDEECISTKQSILQNIKDDNLINYQEHLQLRSDETNEEKFVDNYVGLCLVKKPMKLDIDNPHEIL